MTGKFYRYYHKYDEKLFEHLKSIKSIANYYQDIHNIYYQVEDFISIAKPIEEGIVFRDWGIINDFTYIKNGKPSKFNGPAFFSFDTVRLTTTVGWYFKGNNVNIRNYIDEGFYYKWLTENGIDANNITPEDENIILMRFLL